MDSANHRTTPDLYYAHRDLATIHDPIATIAEYGQFEERVDGNSYSTFADHDSVGYECALLIDELDLPILVYAERQMLDRYSRPSESPSGTRPGRGARKPSRRLPTDGRFQVSAPAFFPDGSIGVAYGVTLPDPDRPDRGHRVKFASNQTGTWVTEIVDETTWCGEYCRLAISSEGVPAIVYKDIQSHVGREHHFLNYAELEVDHWVKESVDEFGEIGVYNSFWIDAEDRAFVASYAEKTTRLFYIGSTDHRRADIRPTRVPLLILSS